MTKKGSQKWSKEYNQLALTSYMRVLQEGSKPVGQLTPMYWGQEGEEDRNLFKMKEQRLKEQIITIRKFDWFTNVEIEDIRGVSSC